MFQGFSGATVDFMWGIRFNNDRAWFAEHKQEFQDAVMTPTKALAGELYDWFQKQYPDLHLNVHISRIYRDARRLFGRGPLNDHIWFSFQNAIENRGEAPCFWFQVGADGYGCGAGKAGVGARIEAAEAAAPALQLGGKNHAIPSYFFLRVERKSLFD